MHFCHFILFSDSFIHAMYLAHCASPAPFLPLPSSLQISSPRSRIFVLFCVPLGLTWTDSGTLN